MVALTRTNRLLSIALVSWVLAGCGDRPTPPARLELEELTGRMVDPLAGEAGVAVFIFVRTDCPISNRYAPEISRLYDEFRARDVAFWLVYPDPDESADTIRKHLETYKYPCPALRDPRHGLVDLTGASVTPEAAVFDRKRRMVYRGRIDDRYVDFGHTRPAPTRHCLEEAVAATLDGRAVEPARTKAVGCLIADLPRREP